MSHYERNSYDRGRDERRRDDDYDRDRSRSRPERDRDSSYRSSSHHDRDYGADGYDRGRDRSRDHNRDQDRGRERSRDRERDRDRDRDRDQDRDRYHNYNGSSSSRHGGGIDRGTGSSGTSTFVGDRGSIGSCGITRGDRYNLSNGDKSGKQVDNYYITGRDSRFRDNNGIGKEKGGGSHYGSGSNAFGVNEFDSRDSFGRDDRDRMYGREGHEERMRSDCYVAYKNGYENKPGHREGRSNGGGGQGEGAYHDNRGGRREIGSFQNSCGRESVSLQNEIGGKRFDDRSYQNDRVGGRSEVGSFHNDRGGRREGGPFHNDRGGKRYNGGGGGRGKGRGAPSAIAHNPKEAISNLILADVTANFKFYLYGIDCTTRDGKQIPSRRRRQELFTIGLDLLLQKEGFNEKQVKDLKRVVFFEGSFFYSSRKIPGLDAQDVCRTLVGNGDDALTQTDEGDKFRITNVHIFDKPEFFMKDQVEVKMKHEKMIAVDFRCANCTSSFPQKDSLLSHCRSSGHSPVYDEPDENRVPSNEQQFLSFCNTALQRAMSERMARWGREYIDPNTFEEPSGRDGRSLGVKVFRAYTCEFGLLRYEGRQKLALTVDLRAKVLRTKSFLEHICEGRDPNTIIFDQYRREEIKRQWTNEQVICLYDKRTYSVIDILFDESPTTKLVPNSNESHADYFQNKKGLKLEFPRAKPMLAVLGRNQSTIFLPAEFVCGNELDVNLQSKLPFIASFDPPVRNEALEEMKRYLKPGGQKTKGKGGGLLPALGIVLGEDRVKVQVDCLPIPSIIAARVRVPEQKGKNWSPCLNNANFNVNPGAAVTLNTIVVYHRNLSYCYIQVYNKIRDMVNNFNSLYRFGSEPYKAIEAGDMEHHWEAYGQYFGNKDVPQNVFVLDFTLPPKRSQTDPAYSVVKQMLGKAGYLSQFINFNVVDHGRPRDTKRSNTILQGTSRQILSKCGVRVWWIEIPKTVPLPAVFVGIDVFHAPRKYNPMEKRRTAKESCAAVVVQLIRKNESTVGTPTVELYSITERREAGKEMDLSNVAKRAVSEALNHFGVNPMSCIVWRDGVGDPAIKQITGTEIPAVRSAIDEFKHLSLKDEKQSTGMKTSDDVAKSGGRCPLAYVICQKRISTKFLSADGKMGMPAGAMIDSLHTSNHEAFYINGTSPTFSTPKPVRFVIAKKDEELNEVSISGLSWAFCHDYPNWTGPIKVPSILQMAHKLAELAGNYDDCGDSINSKAFANKIHFL